MALMYTNILIGCPNYVHPKSIKKCSSCSKTAPDTEYITNLRKINLKNGMLVHTFCAPPLAIHQ